MVLKHFRGSFYSGCLHRSRWLTLYRHIYVDQRRASLPQALVYEHSGQHLEIELFDEDPDKDDFLGRCVSF